MNESLEELKAIIDNAPECATHYDEDGGYVKIVDDVMYHYSLSLGYARSSDYMSPCELRSLSDIKRIIELMEQVKWVRNQTLSDLCHATQIDGATNSEQGVNTVREIQKAIIRLVGE